MMRNTRFMWIVIGLVVVIGGFLVGRFLVIPSVSPVPDNLGWRGDEGFRFCPSNLYNCVSSTAERDSRFYVEPIAFSGSVEAAHDRLVSIINNMARSRVLTDDGNYIHAEYRSLTWGFRDDTEFYIDSENNLVHVRSAARIGGGDMGVNRNRVETIREQF